MTLSRAVTGIAPLALDLALAERLAEVALANVAREYPAKPEHVLLSEADLRAPRALHPAFHGSYDWHSCVHMHWTLAYIRRRFPGLASRDRIDAILDLHFSADAIAGEVEYLARPHSASFERSYGWAWLLKLAAELGLGGDAESVRWSRNIQPLAARFVARYHAYLPQARYPVRHGMHANSAFGLAFAVDYARQTGDPALEARCTAKAREWFLADRDAPARWEPSGADFLSPALMEAELLRRVLDRESFAAWFARFLPGFAAGEPQELLGPVAVGDRGDPQIVHLDGLNFSRAWCFAGIARTLPEGDARAVVGWAAARAHLDAAWPGLESSDYMGAHWLASFALLALDAC